MSKIDDTRAEAVNAAIRLCKEGVSGEQARAVLMGTRFETMVKATEGDATRAKRIMDFLVSASATQERKLERDFERATSIKINEAPESTPVGTQARIVNPGSVFNGCSVEVTGHGRNLMRVEIVRAPPNLRRILGKSNIWCMESELMKEGDTWKAQTTGRR